MITSQQKSGSSSQGGADKRVNEMTSAATDLMVALEEWKSAGAHVSTPVLALHRYVAAIILHGFDPASRLPSSTTGAAQ